MNNYKSRYVDRPNRSGFDRTHTLIDIDTFSYAHLKKFETADGDLYGYRFSKTVPEDRKETKVWGIPGMKLELFHYEPAFIARAQFEINDVTFPQAALDEANPAGDPATEPDFSDNGDKYWVHSQLPKVEA